MRIVTALALLAAGQAGAVASYPTDRRVIVESFPLSPGLVARVDLDFDPEGDGAGRVGATIGTVRNVNFADTYDLPRRRTQRGDVIRYSGATNRRTHSASIRARFRGDVLVYFDARLRVKDRDSPLRGLRIRHTDENLSAQIGPM